MKNKLVLPAYIITAFIVEEGKCGTSSLIYRAHVVTEETNNNSKTMTYYGQTTRNFKTRFGEHKTSFSTPHPKRSSTGGVVKQL